MFSRQHTENIFAVFERAMRRKELVGEGKSQCHTPPNGDNGLHTANQFTENRGGRVQGGRTVGQLKKLSWQTVLAILFNKYRGLIDF